jgi:hypothetical protein
VAKRQSKTPVNPYRSAGSPEDLGPCDRIAFDIISDRRDLLPSVDRIMTAELDDEARLRALSLFRDSLGASGDPHRDPRVAIASGAAGDRS